ncbi:MAG: hypothetical protein ACI9JY_001543, partial [Saprospiraceae bacterium]
MKKNTAIGDGSDWKFEGQASRIANPSYLRVDRMSYRSFSVFEHQTLSIGD